MPSSPGRILEAYASTHLLHYLLNTLPSSTSVKAICYMFRSIQIWCTYLLVLFRTRGRKIGLGSE